jgi:hypothetical protein
VEREHVDGAALAVDVERDLRGGKPTPCAEPAHERLDERGVVAVEQALGLLGVPVDPDDEPGRERGTDLLQDGDRHLVPAASLDALDRGARYAHGVREVRLAPAAPLAERASTAAEPDRVDGATMAAEAYRSLIRP